MPTLAWACASHYSWIIMNGHRKRCKRYDVPGHAHYLTFSCFLRQPFFDHPQLATWVWDAVAMAKERHSFDLWAYAIMPEHIHLVIARHDYRVEPIANLLKAAATRLPAAGCLHPLAVPAPPG